MKKVIKMISVLLTVASLSFNPIFAQEDKSMLEIVTETSLDMYYMGTNSGNYITAFLMCDNPVVHNNDDDKYYPASPDATIVTGNFKFYYTRYGDPDGFGIVDTPLTFYDIDDGYTTIRYIQNNTGEIIKDTDGKNVPDFISCYIPLESPDFGKIITYAMIDGRLRCIPYIEQDGTISYTKGNYVRSMRGDDNDPYKYTVVLYYPDCTFVEEVYRYSPTNKQFIFEYSVNLGNEMQ